MAAASTSPEPERSSSTGARSRATAPSRGGLWKSAEGTLTIDGTTVSNNDAAGAAADQGGGGIYNDGAGGLLTVRNTTVSGNTATGAAGSGGGLFNNVGGTTVVTNSSFQTNSARRAGGAIEDNAGTRVTVIRTVSDGNTTGSAPGNGGAVHITGAGTVTVDSSRVVSNTAANQGGGLWNSGAGSPTVRYTTVSNNSAAAGGGLYQFPGLAGLMTVENSLVAGNTATAAGGGLAADGATVVVENTTVSGNTAASGGGLASGGGQFLISSATVASNTATTAGGGLFRIAASGDSLISPDNTIVADNTAPTGANLAGQILSGGYNLFETTDGGTVVTEPGAGPDVTGADPGLQPLADNGGPTLTQALLAASPAAGTGRTNLVFDQRGYTRRGTPSIGAFEFGAIPVSGEDGPVAGPPAGTPSAFGLSAATPNPVRSAATLRVNVTASEPVEVALYDALGRLVQTLYSGTPAAESTLDVQVEADSLAPGVYVVRATSASAAATQRITVVR